MRIEIIAKSCYNDIKIRGAENPNNNRRKGKNMKTYEVREYRTANDGSEYETERYTITEDELDETREGLDELVGAAVDRYEIEEI